MAIYSLRLTPIGKTTQRQPFTAAAHLGYIARKDAASHTMAERMPEGKVRAMRWLRAEEKADRVNARVADKLVMALPRELTLQQQITLVHTFSEKLTQGRASWFASIHARGKDRENPHCHLLVRDRDIHTRLRVVMFSAGAKEIRERAAKGLSAPTTLRDIRRLWEQLANQALRDAGRVERIDRRTLAAQGIARAAQVHEGPNIRAMHARGFRPQSRERVYRNRAVRRRGVPPTRLVRYPEIDRGLTRLEYNTALRQPLRVGMDDRTTARIGAVAREILSVSAQPPMRQQAEPRPAVFNMPEPARATPRAAPVSPPQRQAVPGSHQPMRTENVAPPAPFVKIKPEEREQPVSARKPELHRAVPPVAEPPRPPVETPVRAGGLSFVARLLREEDARREVTTPVPEPPPAMSPTPPPRHEVPVDHQPMRVEDMSPTARLLKIKQEEKERSAARSSELPRAAAPIAEPPRPPVEAPVRAEELSLSARLRKIKEEEARRPATKPAPEPPRAMSVTERLRQAKGIEGAKAMPVQDRDQERGR